MVKFFQQLKRQVFRCQLNMGLLDYQTFAFYDFLKFQHIFKKL